MNIVKSPTFKPIIVFLLAFCLKASAMQFVFHDPTFSFETLRLIGTTYSGGADIGESLLTVYKIKNGDDTSWYKEWYSMAERRKKFADEFLYQGHSISAQQEYLRASNYYRSAEFFLHINPQDSRILKTWSKSRDSFLKAAELSDGLIQPVEIPFEKTTLPGYFCLIDKSKIKRPLLILQTGFDGTGEELYFTAREVLKHGYNCLIFEGPGQGRVIRIQHIPFRPNWESVVTPVVNYALTREEVDAKKIALMGISFGGFLVPRAVAFEHRVKACIADGGIYDFGLLFIGNHINLPKQLLDPKTALKFNKGAEEEMRTNTAIRWLFSHGMYTFNVKTPSELVIKTQEYKMKDYADKIKCNMLIVDSTGDKSLAGQAAALYKSIKSPKTFMLFTAKDGAEEHTQAGAMAFSTEKIFNWLDDVMKR